MSFRGQVAISTGAASGMGRLFAENFATLGGDVLLCDVNAEPQEIIDLCLFIASDKGQFINGENIMIDGGRNAMGRA